jgi:hypothetical protein
MQFVLILLMLVGENYAADSLQPPMTIGQFATLQECKDAAASAQFIKTGTYDARGYIGAEFMCVRNK